LQEKVSSAIERSARAGETPPVGHKAADHCGVWWSWTARSRDSRSSTAS
jgi:hypothetical protein